MKVKGKYVVGVSLIILIILGILYLPQFIFLRSESSDSGIERFFEEVRLSMDGKPILNSHVNLTLTVITSSQSGRGNSTLQILLPNNFELIQGNLTWNVSIAENETVNLSVVVKAFQTGKSVIIGWAGPSSYPKYDGDELYITTEETSGSANHEPPRCQGDIFEVIECMRAGTT